MAGAPFASRSPLIMTKYAPGKSPWTQWASTAPGNNRWAGWTLLFWSNAAMNGRNILISAVGMLNWMITTQVSI